MALSTVVPENPIGIKGMFTTKNPTFTKPVYRTKKKLFLHSTATPGAPAQNFFSAWNSPNAGASVEFVVDDKQILQYLPIGKDGKNCIKTWHCGSGKNGSCNTTHIATEMCEPIQAQLIPINYRTQGRGLSNRTYSVTRIQTELTARGYLSGTPDGQFGPNTENAVKKFQQDNGLKVTGQVDKTTLAKMASRPGSYAAYDVEGATPFFNACYNNTIKLFAWLCEYVGANPMDTICHCEGYKLGVSSNHSDVMHWFVYHNKTMDDFRADLKAAVEGKWIPLGSDPVTANYRANVQKAVDAGIINTPTYWTALTKDEDINVNYVWALLRQTGQCFCKRNAAYGLRAMQAIDLGEDVDWTGVTIKDSYNLRDIKNIMDIACKIADADHKVGTKDWGQLCDSMHAAGIMNSPDVWKNLTADKVVVPNVHAMIRQTGAYACTLSYSVAIEVLVDAIKMNSPDYWNDGKYSVTNLRFLFQAIAANL